MVELRRYYHAGELPPVLVQGAEAMGVCWEPREQSWQDFLAACDRHRSAGGDLTELDRGFVDPQGYPLGKRIATYLRRARPETKRGRLSEQRRRELAKRGLLPSENPPQ
ncbi:hypothetical protein [Halostreptopolyspora alba]|uniref:hypothetical protein n=1 Tax=Halostreptopolyspora alba TaxID=2487137 RepID=UPI0026CBE168